MRSSNVRDHTALLLSLDNVASLYLPIWIKSCVKLEIAEHRPIQNRAATCWAWGMLSGALFCTNFSLDACSSLWSNMMRVYYLTINKFKAYKFSCPLNSAIPTKRTTSDRERTEQQHFRCFSDPLLDKPLIICQITSHRHGAWCIFLYLAIDHFNYALDVTMVFLILDLTKKKLRCSADIFCCNLIWTLLAYMPLRHHNTVTTSLCSHPTKGKRRSVRDCAWIFWGNVQKFFSCNTGLFSFHRALAYWSMTSVTSYLSTFIYLLGYF